MIGTDAWVQVVGDEVCAEEGYRARNAWRRNAWKEDREKAKRVAQQVRRAAALTAELAAHAITRRDFAMSLPSTLRRLTWGQVAHTLRPK